MDDSRRKALRRAVRMAMTVNMFLEEKIKGINYSRETEKANMSDSNSGKTSDPAKTAEQWSFLSLYLILCSLQYPLLPATLSFSPVANNILLVSSLFLAHWDKWNKPNKAIRFLQMR